MQSPTDALYEAPVPAAARGLGDARDSDELQVSEVIRLAWLAGKRFLFPLLPKIRYLLAAIAIGIGLIIGIAYWVAILSRVGIDGMINANPLHMIDTAIFMLDPAEYVDVERLAVSAREVLRFEVIFYVIASVVVGAAIIVPLLFLLVRFAMRVNQVLRVALIERMQALSLQHHQGSAIGDSIYRVYQDSAMITSMLGAVFWDPLRLLVGLGIALGLFVIIDPVATVLVLFVVAAPIIYTLVKTTGTFRSSFRAARETNSRLTSRIQETLSAIKVIKAYGAEDYEQERFERASKTAFGAAFAARHRFAVYGILLFGVTGASLIYIDYRFAMNTIRDASAPWGLALAGFAAWSLAAFNLARGRASDASRGFEGIAHHWARVQDMAVGMDRVFEILSTEPGVKEDPNPVPFDRLGDRIAFRGVTYGYDPAKPVLRGVDLEARPGTITAIVGPTGSGKTTLVSLLPRVFDPQAGTIEIDGTDLRRFELDGLRRRVGIALQQNLLFGTTILENIRYGFPEATLDEVREAARVACADGFIEALPREFLTPLGERGSKLSTGQRQRLGIARAILRDPFILILDEPTSALDAETELRLMQRLSEWGRDRTIFLVTHRLSTIRRADQIVFLRDGRVLEVGSHRELMGNEDGAYRAFVELEEQGLQQEGVA